MFSIGIFFFALAAFAVPDAADTKTSGTDREKAVEQKQIQRKSAAPKTSMGGDIKGFGEQVAQRLDRIVQKKAFDLWGDPWTLQGIPLVFPGGVNGFHLGLKVAIQNIRRQDPHKMQLDAQVLASDQGRYKHALGFDYPRAFDGKFRISARAAYDRDISIKYFGIGNDTKIDTRLLDQESVLYRNVRAGPSFKFQVLRNFGSFWRVGPVFQFKWTDVTVPAGSLLERDNPLGTAGGASHSVGIAIQRDTLDFEPYPSRGSFHELYFLAAGSFTGSDYEYYRGTFTYRKYIPIYRRLTLAHRTLFESLTGDIPFYELGAVGGSDSTIAFGGDRYMRGFQSNRFVDKIRMAIAFEMRWDPLMVEFAGQQIKVGFHPFFDIGRVWPKVFPLQLGSWHASTGWGMRLIWNNRFVVRGDFAVTSERTAFVVELGNSF